jgi:hypothetical protein
MTSDLDENTERWRKDDSPPTTGVSVTAYAWGLLQDVYQGVHDLKWYVNRDFRRAARKAVKRIPKSVTAYEGESELRGILVEELGTEMVTLPEVPVGFGWAESADLLARYRKRSLAEVELGPKLDEARKKAWRRWKEYALRTGRDLDSRRDPDDKRTDNARRFETLLRLGPDVAVASGTIPTKAEWEAAKKERWEALQFMIRRVYKMLRKHKWTSPFDAVEEVVAWARCAWPWRNVRQICNNAWNSLLPLAQANVAMVLTVMKAAPSPGPKSPRGPLGKKRGMGFLRLFQRLSAQIDFWPTNGEVDMPTKWYRDVKDPKDSKALHGFSTASAGREIARMKKLGVLTQIGEHSHYGNRCRRYRLALLTSGDPAIDKIIVPNAEALLRNSSDPAVEAELKALAKGKKGRG